ncbi:MAG: FkbM family methyltransferase, partial [Tateyamaria sp.]
MDAQLHARLADLATALAPPHPVAIVDVGANPLDNPPYAPLADAGLATLLGFEPQPDAHALLNDAAPDHATFVNAAVGAKGDAHLHLYGSQSGLASLYMLRRDTLRYLRRFQGLPDKAETLPVTVEPLDDLDAVERIDLLKLDVQGAELDVIRGGRAKLPNATAVIVELRYLPLYEGEPDLTEVHAELTTQGFRMHKMLAGNRMAVGSRYMDRVNRRRIRSQLIDGDAVYVRDLDLID